MAICSNCGAEMPEEGKFCAKCGTPRAVQNVMESQNVEATVPTVETQEFQTAQTELETPIIEAAQTNFGEPVVEAEQPEIEAPIVEVAQADLEAPVADEAQPEVMASEPEMEPVQFESEQGAFIPEQPVFSTIPTYEAQSAYEPSAPVQPAFQAIPNGGQAFNPASKEPKKRKKGPIIAVISVAVLAIIAIVVALVLLLSPNVAEIDLTNYVTVEYDGVDTDGTAYVYFDKTQLLIDILKEQGEDPSDAYSNKVSLTMNALLNSIEVEVSQTEDLSNGDKITVTIKYDSLLMEESDVEFTKESKEYTVENLTELIAVDPFESITVTFNGTSPDGYATVSNTSDIDCVRWADFEFDVNNGLRNGDTVTLRVSLEDVEAAVNYGYKFTSTSQTYTVEGLDYYYESLEEISDKHMQEYKAEADKVIEDRAEWMEYYGTLTDIQCIGTYFAKYSEHQTNNDIIFVYTATLTSNYGNFDTTTIYIPVYMGVSKVTDGELGYIYGSSSGYLYSEQGYGSFYGYINGDVMYTQFILGEYGKDYTVTSSEGMPTFKETTEENILPAPAESATEETTSDVTGETSGDETTVDETTGEQTEEETTTKGAPAGIF